MSSYPHINNKSSINSSVYEKSVCEIQLGDEELTKVDDSKYVTSNVSKHIGCTRTLPFKCHFCKLTFRSKIQLKKHEQAWHSSSNNQITKR